MKSKSPWREWIVSTWRRQNKGRPWTFGRMLFLSWPIMALGLYLCMWMDPNPWFGSFPDYVAMMVCKVTIYPAWALYHAFLSTAASRHWLLECSVSPASFFAASAWPALVWSYAATCRYRGRILRTVLPSGAVVVLILLAAMYPRDRAAYEQRYDIRRRQRCRNMLRNLSLYLADELSAPSDGVSFFERPMPYGALRKAATENDGAQLLALLKKLLAMEPSLMLCPYRSTPRKEGLAAAIAATRSLDELVALTDFNLNRTTTRPGAPFLWDKDGNHKYVDRVNVLFWSGRLWSFTKAEFRRLYPDLARPEDKQAAKRARWW